MSSGIFINYFQLQPNATETHCFWKDEQEVSKYCVLPGRSVELPSPQFGSSNPKVWFVPQSEESDPVESLKAKGKKIDSGEPEHDINYWWEFAPNAESNDQILFHYCSNSDPEVNGSTKLEYQPARPGRPWRSSVTIQYNNSLVIVGIMETDGGFP